MNNQLLKILDSIKPTASDYDGFGERIIKIIKSSKALHDPENGYALLRNFLKDEIAFLNQEIAFTKKYSGIVFHSNVNKSHKFEKETCEKLLEGLNKLK